MLMRQAALSLLICVPACVSVHGASPVESQALSVQQDDQGVQVLVDGRPFATYLTDAGGRPVVWPIFGPGQVAMTRSWPLGPRGPHEAVDHPHHRSLWFGYEGINGINTWTLPEASKNMPGGRVVHDGFERVESDGRVATIVTNNQYQTLDGQVVALDQRTLRFGVEDDDEDRRWIDFRIKLWSPQGPLVLADTKEGALGVRVAGTMTLDAKQGGRIVNSHGDTDRAAWGKPAAWVDYSGPVEGKTVGIAIFSHPSNEPSEPCWHVRSYGLFTANPFGRESYGQPGPGGLRKEEGETVEHSFRVYLHPGDAEQGRVAEAFEQYAAEDQR